MVSRGQTTFDTLKARGERETKRYICKPGDSPDVDSEPTSSSEVFPVDWNERIYDLGFKENWKTILANGGNNW